jgi:hypothetical protein
LNFVLFSCNQNGLRFVVWPVSFLVFFGRIFFVEKFK